MNAENNDVNSTSSFSFYVIAAIVLIFLFIILMIYSFYVDPAYSYLILGISVLFLLIGLSLLLYFYFFVRVPNNSVPNNNNNNNDTSGVTGTPINSGDVVQLLNVNANQFAAPCGSNNCGSLVSMRSNDSFNQSNGISNNLRKWLIRSNDVANGQPIRYNQTVLLISQDSQVGGAPIAICENINSQVPVTIGSDFMSGSQMWTILRDPTNHESGDIITTNSVVNFRNNVFIIGGLPTYLSTCANQENQSCDETSPGCGVSVTANSLTQSNNITSSQSWIIQK